MKGKGTGASNDNGWMGEKLHKRSKGRACEAGRETRCWGGQRDFRISGSTVACIFPGVVNLEMFRNVDHGGGTRRMGNKLTFRELTGFSTRAWTVFGGSSRSQQSSLSLVGIGQGSLPGSGNHVSKRRPLVCQLMRRWGAVFTCSSGELTINWRIWQQDRERKNRGDVWE